MKKLSKKILCVCIFSSVSLAAFSADIFGALNKVNSAVQKSQDVKKTLEQASSTVESIDRAAEPITTQDSYFIGRTVASNVLTEYKLYTASPKATAYVNKICKAITMNSDTPKIYKDYCVAILDSAEINALSTSGGHIFITTGILKCCNSEDEVAAIIAHEIAHIQLKHATTAIKTVRTTEAISNSATMAKNYTKQFSNLNQEEKQSADFLTSSSISMMNIITETGYTKGQEFKADEKAVSLMADAGYDPNALTDVLKMLKAKSSGEDSGWGKTHPKPETRINSVQKILKNFNFTGISRDVRQSRFENALAGIK